MFYTIYQISNLIDGKIYIGKHQTKDLDDDYMGSGKHSSRAIAKHGIENFKKEILFKFDNEADMNAKEAELVTEEFCLREDTYNLCPGGNGGFGYINSNSEIAAKRDKYENKLAGRIAADKVIIEKYGSIGTNSKAAGAIGLARIKEKRQTDQGFADRMNEISKRGRESALTLESREKRKETMKKREHSKESKNSQFGTMWITNGQENKKIKKLEVIPEGWYNGRNQKTKVDKPQESV